MKTTFMFENEISSFRIFENLSRKQMMNRELIRAENQKLLSLNFSY